MPEIAALLLTATSNAGSLVPRELDLSWIAACAASGALLAELTARLFGDLGGWLDTKKAWQTGMFWGALFGAGMLLSQEVGPLQ